MNRYTRSEPNTEWLNPESGVRAIRPPYVAVDPNDDVKFPNWLTLQNFINIRKLEDGCWVGIYQLAYTWSVCSDITYGSQYAYRWCFKDPEEAFYFCDNIKEFDEIPERRQTLQGHRYTKESRLAATDQLGIKRW